MIASNQSSVLNHQKDGEIQKTCLIGMKPMSVKISKNGR